MGVQQLDDYRTRLAGAVASIPLDSVEQLAVALLEAWKADRQVFICGNGGSAANALHMANDFFYGIAKGRGRAIRVHALSSNQAVMTCLANDVSYDAIFAEQLAVLGRPGDVLVALSGSGNSPNIVAAIERAKVSGIKTFAILGYGGGRCRDLADVAIHTPVDDMQISEDIQLVIGHMLMQWLHDRNPQIG